MPIFAFLAHLIITAAMLLLVARLVKGINVVGWGAAFIAALVLGMANALLKPVLIVLTLPLVGLLAWLAPPLTYVTFGVFLLAINVFALRVVGRVVPGIRIDGRAPALWGGLVLALLNLAVEVVPGKGGW
jgi:putative membrane protein